MSRSSFFYANVSDSTINLEIEPVGQVIKISKDEKVTMNFVSQSEKPMRFELYTIGPVDLQLHVDLEDGSHVSVFAIKEKFSE